MPQIEDNLVCRLERLEKTLNAYRRLHADELTEIERDLAELRREIEMLAKAPAADPERPPADEGHAASEAAECLRRSSLLRVNR